jgi:hypothetical protein
VRVVGGPAEPHRPGLAGGSGDRRGAALGDGLLDGVDTLQDGADLGDELGEVDLADAGHGGKQPGLGVAEQAGAKGAVEVGDGGKQGAQQPDLAPTSSVSTSGARPIGGVGTDRSR